VGGIFSAGDAYEKIKAGSSLVQIYTGLIYEGPGLVKKINQGLVKLLERDGFKNIGEAVGVENK
jgi:dihydroorotate dehydrogenase